MKTCFAMVALKNYYFLALRRVGCPLKVSLHAFPRPGPARIAPDVLSPARTARIRAGLAKCFGVGLVPGQAGLLGKKS